MKGESELDRNRDWKCCRKDNEVFAIYKKRQKTLTEKDRGREGQNRQRLWKIVEKKAKLNKKWLDGAERKERIE